MVFSSVFLSGCRWQEGAPALMTEQCCPGGAQGLSPARPALTWRCCAGRAAVLQQARQGCRQRPGFLCGEHVGGREQLCWDGVCRGGVCRPLAHQQQQRWVQVPPSRCQFCAHWHGGLHSPTCAAAVSPHKWGAGCAAVLTSARAGSLLVAAELVQPAAVACWSQLLLRTTSPAKPMLLWQLLAQGSGSHAIGCLLTLLPSRQAQPLRRWWPCPGGGWHWHQRVTAPCAGALPGAGWRVLGSQLVPEAAAHIWQTAAEWPHGGSCRPCQQHCLPCLARLQD